MESTSVILFSAIIIVVAALIGFAAGKRQEANKQQDDGRRFLDVSGLPQPYIDQLDRMVETKLAAEQAKRNRFAQRMFRRKV